MAAIPEDLICEIPEDLIIDILLRLTVETLLRFRCVSKRWRYLIDSPKFVKSQLNLPNKPQFVVYLVFDGKLRIYYSELNSEYIENPSPNFKELAIPCRDEIFSNGFNFVGHCNGLLCCVCRTKCNFLVFNPLTGKHIQVPPPPEQQGCIWGAWGFGYDRDSDDYNVVTVGRGWNTDRLLWIYSLKSSSWKSIANFPDICLTGNGVFVDGALHWIAFYYEGNASKSIFALNLGNLEYVSVPLPSNNNKNIFHLGVLDGYLYAFSSDYSDDCFGLWVMKEYGLKESWTRLSTYNGRYNVLESLFVSYGSSLVQCKFASFWRKIREKNWEKPMCGRPLVYEPSLVCARSGI